MTGDTIASDVIMPKSISTSVHPIQQEISFGLRLANELIGPQRQRQRQRRFNAACLGVACKAETEDRREDQVGLTALQSSSPVRRSFSEGGSSSSSSASAVGVVRRSIFQRRCIVHEPAHLAVGRRITLISRMTCGDPPTLKLRRGRRCESFSGGPWSASAVRCFDGDGVSCFEHSNPFRHYVSSFEFLHSAFR